MLALFAASFGVGPEAIGFAVAISTITGVFFKMPAGVISDIIGRRKTMLIGLVFFAVIPFFYLGTLYDVGQATGPILAGLLIGLSDGRDFRLACAAIAAILVVSALFFRRTVPASP